MGEQKKTNISVSSRPFWKPLQLGKLSLKTPLLAASGSYSWNIRSEEISPAFGGLVLKGLTLEPRSGHSGLRMTRSGGGLMNAVGLENPGIDSFAEHHLPGLRQNLDIPLIANINGNSFEDYIELSSRCHSLSGIDGIEVNISCPNVKEGGRAFGIHPDTAYQLCSQIRKTTDKPMLVKLSPQVSEILPMVESLSRAGADILTLCNSFPGIALDSQKMQPILGNTWGGLSGAPIKPIVLGLIWEVYRNFPEIPLIGLGGVQSFSDALEYIQAGASAVSLASGHFSNSAIPEKIIQGLFSSCQKHHLDIDQMRGKAHSVPE